VKNICCRFQTVQKSQSRGNILCSHESRYAICKGLAVSTSITIEKEKVAGLVIGLFNDDLSTV
jgi:hypothetical protein